MTVLQGQLANFAKRLFGHRRLGAGGVGFAWGFLQHWL